MKKYIFLPLYFLLLVNFGYARNKEKVSSPQREFRAIWVATVNNIDWPSRPGLPVENQKSEIRQLLDGHKADGMNAVIMQVRPTADAFYPSDLEPWSRYLQGEQGMAPQPFFDPLEYFIEQCHLRGMEFHAWFNPYRIKQSPKDNLSPNHIINQHPDWGWTYGERQYFDPGHPEVRSFLVKVIRDVVRRYDIDAVHFDDYFYPYKVEGESLPDNKTFQKFPRNYTPSQINDWRRDNVNIVIQMLSQAIKEEKPWVKFGVSPFGVWRNKSVDPKGSNTKAGTTNYDDLYADIVLWQREGWIDYTIPQIYWEIGHPTADFSTLTQWWSEHSYGRGMYVGHAVYKLDKNSSTVAWRKSDQLINQIKLVRTTPGISGSAWYSSVQFKRDLDGFRQKLRSSVYSKPAIIPPMPWIDETAPQSPNNLKVTEGDQGVTLSWENGKTNSEMNRARFFAIYGSTKKRKLKSPDQQTLTDITGSSQVYFKYQPGARKHKYYYRITALDRLNNESTPSEIITIKQ